METKNKRVEEPKSERTQILLKKSTKRALKRIAKTETAGSLNGLINNVLEAYVKEYKAKKS